MEARQYLATRFESLKPGYNAVPTANPLRMLSRLPRQQWGFLSVGFGAWTLDSFDFHAVTLNNNALSTEFGVSSSDITWDVTAALMTRLLGAAVFGIAADRFGRKWPFVVNNTLLIGFQIGTGFCHTLPAFLAMRACFGVAMGGIYGNAAATALEDCPEAARGLVSGIFQSGYSFGYLLAAAFYYAFENTSQGWRSLFWFSGGLPVILILARLWMPETQAFKGRQVFQQGHGSLADVFAEARIALRMHWLLLLYMTLLMIGFSFMTHGTEDIYPTLQEDSYGYDFRQKIIVAVVASIGGVFGSAIIGYCGQIFGRRPSIVAMCLLGGALLYPYTFVSSLPGMCIAAFFLRFCTEGAFGVIPVHLVELSPPAFRTFVVGTSYHLGVFAASSSIKIQEDLAYPYPLPTSIGGVERYDYRYVLCIFMACVFAYIITITILGPERSEPRPDADIGGNEMDPFDQP